MRGSATWCQRRPVEGGRQTQLTDDPARLIIYRALVEMELDAPKYLACDAHDAHVWAMETVSKPGSRRRIRPSKAPSEIAPNLHQELHDAELSALNGACCR
jgi:hypothetical protein